MDERENDPMLEDAATPKAATPKAKRKVKAKAKANGNDATTKVKTTAKAKAAPKAKSADGTMGRPASEATVERRKKVLQFAKAKNGIDNISLAEKLGCTTAQSQMVCRALVNAGKLKMAKDKLTGRVTYRVA
jgi:hypothetical protein